MGRRRTRKRIDWPRGLDESKPGYFVWRNPATGERHAIGRVALADAKLQAIEANVKVAGAAAQVRLVDKLNGPVLTLGQWLDTWTEKLGTAGGLAANTVKSYRTSANAVKATEAGDVALAKLRPLHLAEALEDIGDERGARTAQACQSMLKTALTAAVGKGRIDVNPALQLAPVKVTVQRQRFTWETFSQVWATRADWPVWLVNAVALALVTGQRREDIAAARFADFDAEFWRLEQGKGTVATDAGKVGRRLAIPLALRLDALGMSLRDVLTACRRTGVVSKHLIHQVQPYGNSPVGSPIFHDTLTKRFSEAVEAVLKGDNLPTFHELRSLAKRLYKAQGGVDTKALLGHSTDATAALYEDARGAEFAVVKVG